MSFYCHNYEHKRPNILSIDCSEVIFQALRIALKKLNRLSRKSACHYTSVAPTNFNPLHKKVINNKAPSTHIRIFFNPQLFLSGYGFRPQISGESATSWIRSPEWKFLKTLWIRKRLDVKSGYFLSGDVTRSSPVRYCEYCTSFPGSLKAEQDANFARRALGRMLCCQNFTGVLVKSESRYAWTGKFDLNTDTCGCGNFWIWKEKFADSKISGYVWTGPKTNQSWKIVDSNSYIFVQFELSHIQNFKKHRLANVSTPLCWL